MSQAGLIYNACNNIIRNGNMNELDLSVIASTIASTDKLVRQNKQQKEEIDLLREKIASLNDSALQIKTLYEQAEAKAARAKEELATCASKCSQLEEECREAESDKINANLILQERLAENERQHEKTVQRYQSLITDLTHYLSTPGPDPVDSGKKRDLKHLLSVLDALNLPADVKAFFQQAPLYRSKRRKERTKSAVLQDQGCQTLEVELRNHPPLPAKPTVRDCGTDAMPEAVVQQPAPPPPPPKTFCDKATMPSMSTITRATCTSAFIKRVDVGVNFPEELPKSVQDILRECARHPPMLLSPITGSVPLYASACTQTDQPVPEKPELVTSSTMTNLKNIRKRINYRKVEQQQQQQQTASMAEQLVGKIKREDVAAAAASSASYAFVESHDTFGSTSMRSSFTIIWRLLGELVFALVSNSRRFDSQCCSMLNQQITNIREMLEADGRRESELMSTFFSNVRATVEAATGYGVKERGTTPPVVQTKRGPASVPDECDDAMMDVEKEIETVCAAPATKEISNSGDEAGAAQLEPDSFSPGWQIIASNVSSGSKDVALAQSEDTNGTETVSKADGNETEQTGTISPVKLSASAPVEQPSTVLDAPVDRIEQQLQMMEEADQELPTRVETNHQAIETVATVANVPKPLTSAPDERCPPPAAAVPCSSTPPPVPCVSSCYPPVSATATFVSPIKVKETNQLVKDQFKTPTQPPIGKRKLRAHRRTPDEPPQLPHASKRMRFDGQSNGGFLSEAERPTSPTIECSHEWDDWDEKFSSIMAHINGPLKASADIRPLSPINDPWAEEETPGTADSSATEPPTDGTVCEESAPSQMDETKLAEASKSEDNSPEHSLPLERRLSGADSIGEQESPVLPPGVESVVENRAPSDKDECPAEQSATVLPTALEDGEIGEELNQSFSSMGELVIDIDPVPNDGKESTTEWDSPMSPPAHETGCLSVVAPSSPTRPIACPTDSPLSPPLASDRGTSATVVPPPQRIPLFHVALHSHLRQQVQDRKEPIFTFIELHKAKGGQESTHQRHTGRFNAQDKQKLQQLSDILTRYLQCPDWTEQVVNETITAVLNCTQDVHLMSAALLELVVSCGDIMVNVLCSPPAPPLPLVQQKLILIVRHLGYGLEALEQVLLRDLDRRMFQLKGDPLPLTGLIALTFLYIGLEDSKPSETPWKREYSVRLYMFKCLYYFGYKGLPLVYYLLRAFPFALPKKGSAHYDNSDAMIATLRTILMNVNYAENIPGSPESALFRKRELLWLLRNTYGYQQGSPTYDELVVNLVEKIRANKLRNVAHALILVAKRNGFDWARLHIIQKRIYPLLNDYLKQFELLRATGAGSSMVGARDTATGGGVGGDRTLDERIVACIFTIASIMKTQPSNEDASRVMQIFTTIVQLAEGNRAIQEEAIAGLIKFSRFGFVDIFQRLSSWNPDYPISDRIKLMLTTMVHRKPPHFWKQLLQNRIV
ncbi:uncharacterized protein LOC118516356 [Anopheles stephensi]|uniref:uncharacterized protein LOC118516356 n=1 Tax=Anopheles stephensi TaxID=30069 RepID=UPI001658AE0F|nr:uncharacterized protein LOC118516356 [Anopheles stephensi]